MTTVMLLRTHRFVLISRKVKIKFNQRIGRRVITCESINTEYYKEIFIRILFRWCIPRLARTERTQRENRVVKSTYILGQCSLDPRPFLRYSRRRDVQPYESRMWRLTVDDLATSSASHQNRSDAARVS